MLLIMFALMTSIFISCNDNKKSDQEENAQKEQMEAERQAELQAEKQKMEMESNSIAAKAMDTDSLSTLVSALQTAEMVNLLKVSEGPYTVFAPNNSAFGEVDEATLDTLMKPENQQKLGDLLQYHVVEDEITSQELIDLINENDGEYTISTMGGANLTATLDGENVILTDEAGNTAKIVQADIDASNGIVHIIDAVVMRKSA